MQKYFSVVMVKLDAHLHHITHVYFLSATCTVGDVIDHIGFGKFHIIAGIFLGLSYVSFF